MILDLVLEAGSRATECIIYNRNFDNDMESRFLIVALDHIYYLMYEKLDPVYGYILIFCLVTDHPVRQ